MRRALAGSRTRAVVPVWGTTGPSGLSVTGGLHAVVYPSGGTAEYLTCTAVTAVGLHWVV